jgi:hypothetical protein
MSPAAAAVALLLTNGAPITDPRVVQALTLSRESCAELGGTAIRYPEDLVQMVDLTGDGTADDLMVSEGGAFCLPDLGHLYGGTAGPLHHAVIGDHVQTLLPGGWTLIDLERGEWQGPQRRVLIQTVHGIYCNRAGATLCLVAYAWDGARLVSIMDGASIWGAEPDDTP